MLRYLIRRLLVMVPTLIAISMLVFAIIQLPPGSYLETYMAELQSQGENVDQSKIEFLRHEYGLDQPLYVQYLTWAGGLVQGDLGYSFTYHAPVGAVIASRAAPTLLLMGLTLLVSTIIGIWIGVRSAVERRSLARA